MYHINVSLQSCQYIITKSVSLRVVVIYASEYALLEQIRKNVNKSVMEINNSKTFK